MAPCLELDEVRWLWSFWSEDRRRMVCDYEAADGASVRNVQREAGARFERIWLADVLEAGRDVGISARRGTRSVRRRLLLLYLLA